MSGITRGTFIRASILGTAWLATETCARFPANGSGKGFTRLSFRFQLAGPVNNNVPTNNYIYVVAIRVLTPPVGSDVKLADPQYGPSPVIDIGSKNGIVGGLPTHYVIYAPDQTANLYQVYRFPLQTEAPDPTDPSTPINLIWPGRYVGDVLSGSGVDPRPTIAGGDYGNQLGFDIDTSYLGQNEATPQSIQWIQFNILTMNKAALSGTSLNDRVIDAIGDQSNSSGLSFNNPIRVNITTGGTYTDQSSSVPERAGDTFPAGSNLPGVDLTGWSLQVSTP